MYSIFHYYIPCKKQTSLKYYHKIQHFLHNIFSKVHRIIPIIFMEKYIYFLLSYLTNSSFP